MSSSLPVPVVSPNSTFSAESIQAWIEDLAYRNKILVEENRSLKLENQKLKTEVEKLSVVLKNSDEENMPARKLRKIKIEPMENYGNLTNGSLEVSQPPDLVFTCKLCKKDVKTRRHCTVCGDFVLCVGCYEKQGHPHKMMKVVNELDNINNASGSAMSPDTPVSSGNTKPNEPVAVVSPILEEAKRFIAHAQACKIGMGHCDDCGIWKHVLRLFYNHARRCMEQHKCGVPFCTKIKQELQRIRARINESKKV